MIAFYDKTLDLLKQANRRSLAEFIDHNFRDYFGIKDCNFETSKNSIDHFYKLVDFRLNKFETDYEINYKFAVESIGNQIAEIFSFTIEKSRLVMDKEVQKNFEIFISLIDRFLFWQKKIINSYSLALTDELTGLYNYRFLCQAMDFEIIRAKRFLTDFSVLFLDLDRFKCINDNYGHLTGSAIIKEASTVIQKCTRATDIATRYGGDEFVILALETNSRGAEILAQRIRQSIEDHTFSTLENNKIGLTVSIGIASYPVNADNRNDLISFADKAMYYSKSIGKNIVSTYNKNINFGALNEYTSRHKTP